MGLLQFNTMHDEHEFYDGELHDFILELVKKELKNIPEMEFNRRKELCQKFLDSNKEIGIRSEIKNTIMSALRSTSLDKIDLSSLDFRVQKGSKHTKLKFHDKPYSVVVSATPKDRSAWKKIVSDVENKFF